MNARPTNDDLRLLRALRKQATARIDARIGQAKSDLAPATLKSRLSIKLRDEAKGMGQEAVYWGRNHKGLLAGGIAAILAWFFRRPLADGMIKILDRYFPSPENPDAPQYEPDSHQDRMN